MMTLKLSRIVMEFTPELYNCLKPGELDSTIVLRDGLEKLNADEAIEIIQYSIYEHQKDAFLH